MREHIVYVPENEEEFTIRVIRHAAAGPPHPKGEAGIDVSRWQGVIDWDKVAGAGIRFAGIRATTGATGEDIQFKRNWAEAKRVKIQRLAYHYFTNNTPDAIKQLDNFLEFVGDDRGELRMVCDVEPTSGQVIANKQSNTDAIRQWLTECEARTGRRPAIYTNGWAWSACTTIPAWSSEYPLWMAQYTTAPAPTVPKPWVKYMAWQYSSTGKVAGIVKDDGTPANVDLDRWGEL